MRPVVPSVPRTFPVPPVSREIELFAAAGREMLVDLMNHVVFPVETDRYSHLQPLLDCAERVQRLATARYVVANQPQGVNWLALGASVFHFQLSAFSAHQAVPERGLASQRCSLRTPSRSLSR